jgi:hypothetical protein
MGGSKRESTKDTAKAGQAGATDERHSPTEGATRADGGYAERHGPRFDADGWGEANPVRGTHAPEPQGHQTGERSFDHGPEDPAAAQAASEAALREPGERGAGDARPPPPSPEDEEAAQAVDPPATYDGRQRDYGQGGGQGYVHTGKPGAPGPDGKTD